MPLTPAPTFAVRQSTTGEVGRVAGFGPRRDAGSEEAALFCGEPVRLGLDVDHSEQPQGARPLPNVVEHGDLARRRRPMGRLPRHRHLPPLLGHTKRGRTKKVWAAGHGGRQAPRCWGPTSRLALACTSTTWPCGEGRAPCLTTCPTPTGRPATTHQPSPGGPSIRRQRGALHRQHERCEALCAESGPKHPAHPSPMARGAHPVHRPIRHGRSTEHLPGPAIHRDGIERHGPGQPCPSLGPASRHGWSRLDGTWVDQRWAGDDHVHFSVRGAQEAAQRLIQALAHERALWANRRIQPAKLMAP